jgi:hypothetical protein
VNVFERHVTEAQATSLDFPWVASPRVQLKGDNNAWRNVHAVKSITGEELGFLKGPCSHKTKKAARDLVRYYEKYELWSADRIIRAHNASMADLELCSEGRTLRQILVDTPHNSRWVDITKWVLSYDNLNVSGDIEKLYHTAIGRDELRFPSLGTRIASAYFFYVSFEMEDMCEVRGSFTDQGRRLIEAMKHLASQVNFFKGASRRSRHVRVRPRGIEARAGRLEIRERERERQNKRKIRSSGDRSRVEGANRSEPDW